MTLLNAGSSGVTSPSVSWPPAPPVAGLGPGASFSDRYTIVEEVGAGGMGRVYKAIDRLLGTTVALKLMSAAVTHSEARQRFHRELSVARAITHLNVCRVHDLGEVEGTAYISMEYVEGQTLDDLIRSMGVLSTKQTLAVARQICAALDAIHQAGVVHRDLKPSNIMLDRAGRAIVMDFGMAYQRGDDRLTNAGAVVGTLAYLSPEQARGGEAHPRSDVYALGLILYEMLTGRRPPGDGGPLPLALRDRGDACPPPSHFSPEVQKDLDVLVLRCLERDPQNRFASARDVDEDLVLLQANQSVTGILPRRPSTWPHRSRTGLAAAILAAIAGGAGLWAALRAPRAVRATSVAVLPLDYHGPPEQGYLRNVVPLLVAERLRTVAGVQVAPFGSSRSFAPGDDMAEVARQLGVDAVVKGALTVVGPRIELQADLMRPRQTRPTRVETVIGEAEQLVAAAERLAGGVARAMGANAPAPGTGSRVPQAMEHYFKGRSLIEGWDVPTNASRADEEFARAIDLDPQFAEAYAQRAMADVRLFIQSGDDGVLTRADELARRALDLAPTLPEAHTADGLVQLARGRSAEAAEALERGLKLAPGDDSLCRRVARAYSDLGRNTEAGTMYRRAVQLRPAYWQNQNSLGGFLLRQGQLQEAAVVFQKVIDLHPEADTGYVNLAAALILAGEHGKAEPVLKAALRVNPSYETHNNLGTVYYALGDYEQAATEWRAALDGGAREAIVSSNLGDALRQLKRTAEAHEAYQQAIERGRRRTESRPDDTEARAGLAMALGGDGQCAAARAEAARATADGRVGPTTHYYAAVAYALCGARGPAVTQAQHAIDGGVVSDVRTNPDLKPLLSDPVLQKRLR
jgi:tetratricopeptide (TPR) repeat protein/TolB-like protein